jgi:hypothetical protein
VKLRIVFCEHLQSERDVYGLLFPATLRTKAIAYHDNGVDTDVDVKLLMLKSKLIAQ